MKPTQSIGNIWCFQPSSEGVKVHYVISSTCFGLWYYVMFPTVRNCSSRHIISVLKKYFHHKSWGGNDKIIHKLGVKITVVDWSEKLVSKILQFHDSSSFLIPQLLTQYHTKFHTTQTCFLSRLTIKFLSVQMEKPQFWHSKCAFG